MKTTTKAPVVALILLFSPAAFAQIPVPPGATQAPAPPPAPAAAGAPAETPPPPPPPLADVPPAPPPPVDERINELEQKVEGLSESYQETKTTASSLAKLKFSGYIQGRYAWQDHDDSISGVNAAGQPTNFDRFLVRRGRLKATYNGENAEYLLQIDASSDGVVLKDAEATFVDTWTPFGFRFTMGQFKVPFGYEVLQSSADREMPERARVIRALFPGERDRGARLTGRWEWLRVQAALVNGNFTQNDPVYLPLDQNRYLNTYLRVGGDFGFLVFNLSGEFGQNLSTTVTSTALTVTDSNGDGMLTPDEIKSATTTATTYLYDIWRLGADAQFYYDIAGVGGLALKGEMILSKDTNGEFRGVAADPCRTTKGFGYILTGSQNIGDYFGVAARFDVWNPNRDVAAGTSTTCMNAQTKAANDKISTLGIGPLLYISGNLKASAIYEHLWRSPTLGLGQPNIAPSSAVPHDQFTLQLQAKF